MSTWESLVPFLVRQNSKKFEKKSLTKLHDDKLDFADFAADIFQENIDTNLEKENIDFEIATKDVILDAVRLHFELQKISIQNPTEKNPEEDLENWCGLIKKAIAEGDLLAAVAILEFDSNCSEQKSENFKLNAKFWEECNFGFLKFCSLAIRQKMREFDMLQILTFLPQQNLKAQIHNDNNIENSNNNILTNKIGAPPSPNENTKFSHVFREIFEDQPNESFGWEFFAPEDLFAFSTLDQILNSFIFVSSKISRKLKSLENNNEVLLEKLEKLREDVAQDLYVLNLRARCVTEISRGNFSFENFFQF